MRYVEYDAWDGHDVDASWTAIEQFLGQTQRQQRERVAAEIDRIRDLLNERDTIHEEIVDELEWKIARYTARLKQLYERHTGREDGSRDRLKDRLMTSQQELREEQREHWQDRQTLERERRGLLRELAALDNDRLSEFL